MDVHYISKLNCAGSILQFYALLNSLLNKVTIIAHELSGRLVSSDQVTNVFSYLHRFILDEYFKIYQIVLRKVKFGVLKDTPKSWPNQVEIVSTILKVESLFCFVDFKALTVFIEDSDDVMNFDVLKSAAQVFEENSENQFIEVVFYFGLSVF